MAWIESHQGLEKNGKLLELASQLRINRYQAIGHLHALWWWSLGNAEDGNLSRFSNAIISQACGWTEYIIDEVEASRINEMTNADKVDDFVPALIKCGFLDRENGGLWIHNWCDYTERYFKSIKLNKRIREQTKKRVEKYRNRNASVTQVKRAVTVLTLPDLTVPDLTKPKDKETPIVPKGTEFERAWQAYPKRIGKKAAERYYRASVKTKQDMDDLDQAIRNYLRSKTVGKGYIQNGSTWFNNWRDWINYEEDQHGNDERKGLPSIADIFERARSIKRHSGLRKVGMPATRKVLDGFRDSPSGPEKISGEIPELHRSRQPGHGQAVEGIRRETTESGPPTDR